jgi:hypothetical protein
VYNNAGSMLYRFVELLSYWRPALLYDYFMFLVSLATLTSTCCLYVYPSN